ncbi:hypothetical protein MMC29_006856, partial [Sticta canariensis]|nr:hypothetical protein [Sticta canariensis]
EEYVEDPDDLLLQSESMRCQYAGISLVSNSIYLGTVNSVQEAVPQLTIKFSLITVPGWKSYVQLSFYVCSGSASATEHQSKDFRHTITHHEAHLSLGWDAIYDIEVQEMTGGRDDWWKQAPQP